MDLLLPLILLLLLALGVWYAIDATPLGRSSNPTLRRIELELHATREEIRNRLKQLEFHMTTSARALMEAIVRAETKLDGYATVINANTQAIRDAQAALLALKDDPTPHEVQSVIDDLDTHLAVVDASIASLTASPVPPAPPADQTQPVPGPAVAP